MANKINTDKLNKKQKKILYKVIDNKTEIENQAFYKNSQTDLKEIINQLIIYEPEELKPNKIIKYLEQAKNKITFTAKDEKHEIKIQGTRSELKPSPQAFEFIINSLFYQKDNEQIEININDYIEITGQTRKDRGSKEIINTLNFFAGLEWTYSDKEKNYFIEAPFILIRKKTGSLYKDQESDKTFKQIYFSINDEISKYFIEKILHNYNNYYSLPQYAFLLDNEDFNFIRFIYTQEKKQFEKILFNNLQDNIYYFEIALQVLFDFAGLSQDTANTNFKRYIIDNKLLQDIKIFNQKEIERHEILIFNSKGEQLDTSKDKLTLNETAKQFLKAGKIRIIINSLYFERNNEQAIKQFKQNKKAVVFGITTEKEELKKKRKEIKESNKPDTQTIQEKKDKVLKDYLEYKKRQNKK